MYWVEEMIFRRGIGEFFITTVSTDVVLANCKDGSYNVKDKFGPAI